MIWTRFIYSHVFLTSISAQRNPAAVSFCGKNNRIKYMYIQYRAKKNNANQTNRIDQKIQNVVELKGNWTVVARGTKSWHPLFFISFLIIFEFDFMKLLGADCCVSSFLWMRSKKCAQFFWCFIKLIQIKKSYHCLFLSFDEHLFGKVFVLHKM